MLAIDGDPGNAARLRASGDDDFARRGEHLRPAVRDLDPALPRQPAATFDPVDLVLLEEKLDPTGQPLDDLVLPRLHLTHVEADRGLADCEPPVLPLLRDLERVGVFEERLRRNAPPVEAGATEGRRALDDGRPQSELCRTDGRHVAAGPRANHHEVVHVLSGHITKPSALPLSQNLHGFFVPKPSRFLRAKTVKVSSCRNRQGFFLQSVKVSS